mgnify:CR=1 FL=1
MDWAMSAQRYHAMLIPIVAELFRLARIVPGERPELDPEAKTNHFMVTLPRYVYRAAMLILVPAEAAMRRLLIIAAHAYGLDLKAPQKRRGPAVIPAGKGGGASARPPAFNMPAFNMFDPRKSFEDYWLPELEENRAPFPAHIPEPKRFAPVSAITLWRRINALHGAVSDLPKAARRYARWASRCAFALANDLPLRPRRLDVMRPGRAPGLDKRHRHEVQDVLRDCHSLAFDIHSPSKWQHMPSIWT